MKFLFGEKGTFSSALKKKKPLLSVDAKEFCGKKKKLLYFLKDVTDVINTNENERLKLRYNHKTEVE